MLKLFKNKNFPVFIFVAAAIVNLVLLFTLFIGFRFFYRLVTDSTDNTLVKINENSLESSDPLISKVPKFENSLEAPLIGDIDPSIGPTTAPVTIVQFSDFKCEFCSQQESELKKIIEDYKGQVRLIWKDFPENFTTSESYRSAVAGRCAQKQNKFWEYHDLLYSSNGEATDDLFISLASQLSLDTDAFRQCLQDPAVSGLVLDNIDEAQALGISGIPFVYVNDMEMLGEVSYADIKQAVDYELSKLQ